MALGMKNKGKKDFRFNPIGFKTSQRYKTMVGCDVLLLYTDLENNRVGNTSYDAILNGSQWQLAGKYQDIIDADTTFILYDELGEPRILDLSTYPNITEDKFFIDLETGRCLFFETSLTGNCLVNACKFMGFNDGFYVLDGGTYEPYILDGHHLYVLKEGVTYVPE